MEFVEAQFIAIVYLCFYFNIITILKNVSRILFSNTVYNAVNNVIDLCPTRKSMNASKQYEETTFTVQCFNTMIIYWHISS